MFQNDDDSIVFFFFFTADKKRICQFSADLSLFYSIQRVCVCLVQNDNKIEIHEKWTLTNLSVVSGSVCFFYNNIVGRGHGTQFRITGRRRRY